MGEESNIIVIAGPTASGKTSLAVKLARYFGGEIVSADSRQVYRGMDIGSGKDLAEYKGEGWSVPYHCIDVADPDQIFTLYDYQKHCSSAVENIIRRGIMPFLSGGTGLYIESFIKDYKLPDISVNNKLREKLEVLEKNRLEEILEEEFPEIYINTDLSNKKRIIRSIERGKSQIKDFSGKSHVAAYSYVVLVTRWERAVLIERIKKRLDERFESGMIDEVEMLLRNGVKKERLILFGMEYKFITEYLNGKYSLLEMKERLFTAIRQLSKRQMTYFRGMEKRGIKINYADEADFNSALSIINKSI